MQAAELQRLLKLPQGPHIHLAVQDFQGGERAIGVHPLLQKQSLED